MFRKEVVFRDKKIKIETELETYKGLPRPDSSNTNILKCWRAHAKIPLLSQIARKYLAIPFTSALNKRIFSAAGSVIIDARTMMILPAAEKNVGFQKCSQNDLLQNQYLNTGYWIRHNLL